MRKFLSLAAVAVLALSGCKKDEEPAYTATTDVVRRSNPPPILINPMGTNADGVATFQLGANDFISSLDKEALVRSAVSFATIERDRTGNKAVRIGNGNQDTNTDEAKKLKKQLEALNFTVTVTEKNAVTQSTTPPAPTPAVPAANP